MFVGFRVLLGSELCPRIGHELEKLARTKFFRLILEFSAGPMFFAFGPKIDPHSFVIILMSK